MKGIYIASITENRTRDVGVLNKIRGQLKGFKNAKVDMDFIYMKDNYICWNDKLLKNIKKNNSLVFFYGVCKILKSTKEKFDFVYIRYSVANIFLFKLCKIFHKRNIKVIVEIATYPYEKELNVYNSVVRYLMLKTDRYITKNLSKYVSNIVTFTENKSIYNIDTINIQNGIDLEKIKFTGFSKGEELNIIAVANVTFAHGYDRLIKGLSNYYKNGYKRKVSFHIVGDGAEVESLKNLVNDLGLSDIVIFYGAKYEPQLTDIYKKCQIGVTALGMYRKDVQQCSILKSREYAARGIPFISGYDDIPFMDSKYVLRVSNNDEDIDVIKVLEFYDSCNISDTQIRLDSERLGWNEQIIELMRQINNKYYN